MPESPPRQPITEELPDFAVALYGEPGVAAACLLLQEQLDVDVNIVLFAAYLGAVRGHRLTAEQLPIVKDAVGLWHTEVVRSLRRVRKRLKTGPPPAPNNRTSALRAKIQALEIEAELIELSELGQMAATLVTKPCCGSSLAKTIACIQMVALTGGTLGPDEDAAITTIASAATRKAG